MYWKSFQNKKIITKSIEAVFISKEDDTINTNYTSKVDIQKIDDVFFSTKFQEEIQKKTELRIFFFRKKIYTVAALSDHFENEIDIRILIAEEKIEYYPFKLSIILKKKLNKLMNLLHLEMASIDIIVDKEDNYYFIDLNPYGQLSMLSLTCFPNIERDIVKKIINDYESK